MNYILIVLILIANRGDAHSESSKNRRSINDSFNINIGAGYAVGTNQASNIDLPNGTSNISISKNHYTNPLKVEGIQNTGIRGPRILTNFTPHVTNPIPEKTKRSEGSREHVSEPQNKDPYKAAPSNIHFYNSPNYLKANAEHFEQPNSDFENVFNRLETEKHFSRNNVSPDFQTSSDDHFNQPNLVDFHNVLNKLESNIPFAENISPSFQASSGNHLSHHENKNTFNDNSSPSFQISSDGRSNLVDVQSVINKIKTKKPYSKVIQVIKVPAIYEIHLQSDANSNVSENKVNVNPTGGSFWKNYFENKPNITTKYSDEYSRWLQNYYPQREEHITKDGEKYYDFSDSPIVSYEVYDDHHSHKDKLNKDDILQPIINHHFTYSSQARDFPNSFDDKEVKHYNSEQFNKPIRQYKDHLKTRKPYYSVSNTKKHIGHNSYNPHEPKSTNKPFYNDIFNSHNSFNRGPVSFMHNQIITENDKPQALHEVPAPFLGTYPQAKPFEFLKTSQTSSHPKLLPAPTNSNTQTKVKFHKLAPSTTKPNNFKVRTNGFSDTKASHSIPVKNKELLPSYVKENLIYGNNREKVLTPYEINIPVSPGSTSVTVPENSDNTAQHSRQNFIYSAKIRDIKPHGFGKPKAHKLNNGNSKSAVDIHNSNNYRHNVKNSASERGVNTEKPHFNTHQNVGIFQANKVDQNVTPSFQKPIESVMNNSPEKSHILSQSSNQYHQVVNMPYQTQKTITIENLISTTSNPNSNLYSTFTSTQKPQEKLSQEVYTQHDTNVTSSGVTSASKQNFSRRISFPGYTMDNNSFTKKRYNGFLKDIQYPKTQQKSAKSLDYIIYITRKSVD